MIHFGFEVANKRASSVKINCTISFFCIQTYPKMNTFLPKKSPILAEKNAVILRLIPAPNLRAKFWVDRVRKNTILKRHLKKK